MEIKKKKVDFVWIHLGSTLNSTGFMSDLFLSDPRKVVKTKEEH